MAVVVTSLRAVNFKHHSFLSINIPEGLVQFGGISGSGKSSAAAAISYALFGKVWKTKSLTRYGEKAFSVRLGLKDAKGRVYSITRVNTPRSLKLFINKKLVAKDDEAQEKILALTGLTFHRYAWGCFLRNDSSLLEVTPEKKYEGVCALAGVVSSDIDQKIQEIHAAKKLKEKRLGTIDQKIGRSEGSIKSIRTELKKYDDLPEVEEGEVEDPDFEEEDETTLTDHQTRLDEIDSTLTNFGDSERASLEKEKVSLEAKLETVEEDLANTEGYDDAYIEVARLANEVRRTQEELELTQKSVAIEGRKRKAAILEFYKAKLPKNVDVADYRDWVAGLREDWKAYEVQVSLREKALESQNKAKDQTIKIFREVKKYFPSLREIKSTKVMLDRLDQLSLRLAPKMGCPCCEARLSLIGGELVEAGEDDEDEGNEVEDPTEAIQRIKNFQDSLRKLQPLATQPIPDEPTKPKKSLAKAEELLEEVEVRQLEIRSIDTGSHPLITKVNTRLKTLERRLKDVSASAEIEIDPNDITDEDLAEHENSVRVRTKALSTKKTLKVRLAKVQKILDDSDSIETLLEEAAGLREKVKTLEAKISARAEAERIAQLYADQSLVQTRLAKEEAILVGLKESRCDLENQIIGLQGLKAKIKEATLLSIEETIIGVNREAQTYLGKLFDTPITVALGLSPKTEGKIEVRVIREHADPKGESKYDDLSDGEKQRVRLAFFLGINTYLDPRLKLIVIDEALNQVEESLNSRSVDLVKGITGTKIIISHEAITGQFEKVLMFH